MPNLRCYSFFLLFFFWNITKVWKCLLVVQLSDMIWEQVAFQMYSSSKGRLWLGEMLPAYRNLIILSRWRFFWYTEYMCNFFYKYVILNQVHDVSDHKYWSSPKLWDHRHSDIFCFNYAVEWWIFFSQLTCFGNTVVSFCVIHSKIRFLVKGLGLWKKQRNNLNSYLLTNCRSPVTTSYGLSAQANIVLYIIY